MSSTLTVGKGVVISTELCNKASFVRTESPTVTSLDDCFVSTSFESSVLVGISSVVVSSETAFRRSSVVEISLTTVVTSWLLISVVTGVVTVVLSFGFHVVVFRLVVVLVVGSVVVVVVIVVVLVVVLVVVVAAVLLEVVVIGLGVSLF